MNFIYESHRNAFELLENNPLYSVDWNVLKSVIQAITDAEIQDYFHTHSAGKNKSLSVAINKLLRDKLVHLNWQAESFIFQDPNYQGESWRLDFAKGKIAGWASTSSATAIRQN